MASMRLTLALGLALIGVGAAPAHAQDGLPLPSRAETPAAVARRFYDAFCSSDFAVMERLYAPDVRFRDEIFAYSDRAGTMGMWRTVLAPEQGARITYELQGVEGDTAVVRWIADYELFGRPVHNEITGRLTVRGGRIVEHHDAFSWDRWARQALPLGRLSTFKPIAHVIKAAMRAGVAVSARLARPSAPEAGAPPAPSRGIVDALPGAGG